MNKFFIRSRGRVEGPFTVPRLHELARRGRFGRFHHVSKDRQVWERASAYPELFPEAGPKKVRRPLDSSVEARAEPDPADTFINELVTATEIKDAVWFYSHYGAQVDEPVTIGQLRELAASEQLLADDYVWTEGMEDWIEARRALPKSFPEQSASSSTDASGPDASSSNMALASLVMGMLGFTLMPVVGSLFAVVFGHIAVANIRKSENRISGRPLAITGLVMGYVVLFIGLVVGIIVTSTILSQQPA